MKTNKIIALTLAVLFALALAAGCTADEPDEPDGSQGIAVLPGVVLPGTSPNVTDPTVTIVDITGRTVTLPSPAARVAGTHNPTLNIAIILGGGGRLLVGFGNKNMAGNLYEFVYPELDDVVEIGRGREINMESVAAVDADLIILPERFANLAEDFEALGIPAAVILPNDESFDTIIQSIRLLGTLTGEDARAEQIISFYETRIAAMRAIAANAAEAPRVMFAGSSSMTSAANGLMLQSAMIEAVGAVNVAQDAGAGGGFAEVSLEEIIAWDPEVIYIPAYASYTVDDIMDNPAWQSISAVEYGRVFVFPSVLEPWDYPTPSTLMGLGWMLNNLYPELYTFEQVIADAQDYYELVYGQRFTTAQLGILD